MYVHVAELVDVTDSNPVEAIHTSPNLVSRITPDYSKGTKEQRPYLGYGDFIAYGFESHIRHQIPVPELADRLD